jgi:putative Holliday junction resolvase
MGWTAQGIRTIERKTLDLDLVELGDLILEYEVKHIVMGWPLNMDGSEGPQAQSASKFAEVIRQKFPETSVELWDERLSTVGAERALLEADLSRAKRKKVIDKMAAVFILQGYLDAHPQWGGPTGMATAHNGPQGGGDECGDL